jgi:hypothetical protein
MYAYMVFPHHFRVIHLARSQHPRLFSLALFQPCFCNAELHDHQRCAMLHTLVDYSDDSEDDSNKEKTPIDNCTPDSCLAKRKNDPSHLPTNLPKKLK